MLSRVLAAALLCVAAPAAAHVPRIHNGPEPAGGARRIELRERWHAGGEHDDHLFGRIRRVRADDDGAIYLVDYQLSQVHVFDRDGRFRHHLSREGDGPGEVRQPNDMIFLPDGSLGLVQWYPGKVIRMNTDGTPLASYPLGGERDARLLVLRNAACRGGTLAFCGEEILFKDGQQGRCRFLATFGAEGLETARIFARESYGTYQERGFIERNEYSLEGGRWAIGPGGEVYTAPIRDRYEIHVHASSGDLERVIEREFASWKRSEEEKQQVADGILMLANGQPIEVEKEIADFEPCVSALYVTGRGDLWVDHSRSFRNLPEGVLARLDQFDPAGRYAERIELAYGEKQEGDVLHVIDEGRFVILRLAGEAPEVIYLEAAG